MCVAVNAYPRVATLISSCPPIRFWQLVSRPFSVNFLDTIAPREWHRTQVPWCPQALLRAAKRVNMPAAHRDPWLQWSVGLLYLANGFSHVSYTQWRHGFDRMIYVCEREIDRF